MRTRLAELLKPLNICLFIATILVVYYFQFPAFRTVVDGVIDVASPTAGVDQHLEQKQEAARAFVTAYTEQHPLPMVMDGDGTALVSVTSVSKTVTFTYQIPDPQLGRPTHEQRREFMNTLRQERPSAVEEACSDQLESMLLEAGLNVRLAFSTGPMETLGSILITPEDC